MVLILRIPIVLIQVLVVLAADAVASPARPLTPDISDVVLARDQRDTVKLMSLVHEHRFTVVVFFSATCSCFSAHRARLAALVHEMQTRDVRFMIIDSERRPTAAPPTRSVPDTDLPIFRDDGGKLARRLEAQYATETFVFDATGAIRYRGGIDDDRKHLSSKPRAYLRDELLSLLAGMAPPYATAKSLGCALRLM